MNSDSSEEEPPYRATAIAVKEKVEEAAGTNSKPHYPLVLLVRDIKLSPKIEKWVEQTFDGLKEGKEPVLAPVGAGGTYFLSDPSGECISVFKPKDEEPKSLNNPKRNQLQNDGFFLSSNGLKRGTKVGEGAAREVMAYLLDHPKTGPQDGLAGYDVGFAGVPPTVPIFCMNECFKYRGGYRYALDCYKFGSLQMFMKNDGNCASRSINLPDIPVEEVHKICLVDIRYANTDRHEENILFRKNGDEKVLIPIDHGYCFPVNFEGCSFIWRQWEQAEQPFNKDFTDYIDLLDSNKDIDLLRRHEFHVPPLFASTLHISTMLLKKGVNHGLAPSAIGKIMCRGTKNKSIIEEIVDEAVKKIICERMGKEYSEIEDMPEEEFEIVKKRWRGPKTESFEKLIEKIRQQIACKRLGKEYPEPDYYNTEHLMLEEDFEEHIMPEEDFEDQLLKTVSPIMESEIIKYKKKFGSV